MLKYRLIYILPILTLVLSACGGEKLRFLAGDMKTEFCGTHINYQYCECAFNENFCEEIVMNKSDASKRVKEDYDKWVAKELQNFTYKCVSEGGLAEKEECKYCSTGKKYVDGKCKKIKIEAENISNEIVNKNLEAGRCYADTDCESKCIANKVEKMICNQNSGLCEKSQEIDCEINVESFGDLSFPMICMEGDCARDDMAITTKRDELEMENKKNIEEQKALTQQIESFNILIGETDNNCTNESLDLSAIDLSAFASLTEKALEGKTIEPISLLKEKLDLYLDKLFSYKEEAVQKLEASEFKELNCELNNYFKSLLDEGVKKAEVLKLKIDELESVLGKLPRQ